jgi:hypothetical protein
MLLHPDNCTIKEKDRIIYAGLGMMVLGLAPALGIGLILFSTKAAFGLALASPIVSLPLGMYMACKAVIADRKTK